MITKFGSCSLNQDGYFIISSRKEGNFGKYLHRLIYEEHYGKIPKNIIIHHIDGNKQTNLIENLEALSFSKHQSIHRQGKKHNKHTLMKISKSKNTSGYFRVSKHKDKKTKQGFLWCYSWYEKGKRRNLTSLHLYKLKLKVLKKGLPWGKI